MKSKRPFQLAADVSLVLGACIAMSNGKIQSETGDVVMQAARVGATLWPITFAAVVGPMVKAIALYYAQRGSRLGTLEVLSASQTLISTIRGCFALRERSMRALLILIIWLFSPIGSQGVLRALEYQQNPVSSPMRIQSFPANAVAKIDGVSSLNTSDIQWSAMAGAALSGWDIGLMHSNGSSSIFVPTVERAGGKRLAIDSTRDDIWRNVRIPFLHLLPGYNESGPFEWVNVSSDNIPPYESLIGIRIRGIPSKVAGNASMIIQSYYQHLSCGPWLNETKWLLDQSINLLLNPIVGGRIRFTSDSNTAGPRVFLDILNNTQRSEAIRSNKYAGPLPKQVLVFGLRGNYSYNIRLCDISTSYVDSDIKCVRPTNDTGLSCAATAVRHTRYPPLGANITAFDAYDRASMLRSIPSIMANSPDDRGVFEKFLENPPLALDPDDGENQRYLEKVPSEVFQARLGMLINTFLRASYDMMSLVGMRSSNLEDDPLWDRQTGAWVAFTKDVYDLKTLWFTLYIISTIVLTLCALANILFRSMTRVPDFLGSISALTRDSPFVDGPDGGSTMDGMERARLLKNKWVRIQDVKPNEKVGRLAFSDAKGPGGLQMYRKYE